MLVTSVAAMRKTASSGKNLGPDFSRASRASRRFLSRSFSSSKYSASRGRGKKSHAHCCLACVYYSRISSVRIKEDILWTDLLVAHPIGVVVGSLLVTAHRERQLFEHFLGVDQTNGNSNEFNSLTIAPLSTWA